jgi:N utilization substance protein A
MVTCVFLPLKILLRTVKDPSTEISIEQARRFSADFEVGDIVEVEVTPRKFGRIAAQTAKQVVMQRIREAERGIIYEEYSKKGRGHSNRDNKPI